MDPREILLKADKELANRGWTAGQLENLTTGAVCAMGALRCAAYGSTDVSGSWVVLTQQEVNAAEAAHEALTVAIEGRPAPYGDRVGVVARWNDTPGRTIEEVHDAFQRAADSLL